MATAERCEGQYPLPSSVSFSLPLEAALSRREQVILPPSVPARLLAEDEWGELMRNRYSARDPPAPDPPKLRCKRSGLLPSAGNKSTNFWERMLQKRRQIRRVNQARKARGWRRSLHPSRDDDLVAAAHEPSHSSPGLATTHDEEDSVVYLPPPNSPASSSLHSPSSSSFSHLASSEESSPGGQFSFFPLGISSLAAHSSTNTLDRASSQSFQSFTSEQVRELDTIEETNASCPHSFHDRNCSLTHGQDDFDNLSTYLELPPEDQHDVAPRQTEAGKHRRHPDPRVSNLT
ncbi:hypothetical protein N7474_004800 [Penicillium riverlandense]|uniref:uncharacterized protein n=1 Tax=Penicillium riverlandense TaxID=1903569 RepID=UPI0025467940|nr:uncharacterized protein N7474_004800 [Penicillium riverlandense]KAJ5819209.1 hypothetical protein N7474_004800 [Penicillium riverlandense]